ncbi:MAG: protein-L-isoaspartate(D-aspartate) O-methyltransferase [Candidatus Omnitrophica bacterium]|jgi:protein-L-isoaspartate(D-aspartate) O-methyltransferase|nr:protein-L-isoaspartate(D-aspartate) O-methyltransferase [Candidatus Omnitrophota bacterium]
MDFLSLRKDMVQSQLVSRGIKCARVLEAFMKIERHLFVPASRIEQAYADHPVQIGQAQTISQPYITALMVELLEINKDDCVLEIGTGSGYQSAILAQLAKEVFTIERIESIATNAKDLLNKLGYSNVTVITGDGTMGYKEKGCFDKIIVSAASPEIPQPLLDQLKQGGRMVIPLGDKAIQTINVVIKNLKIECRPSCACVFVPLVGRFGFN